MTGATRPSTERAATRKPGVLIIGVPAAASPAHPQATTPAVESGTPRPERSFMDRYRHKFCHDVLFDMFQGAWLAKAARWRAVADDLRDTSPDQAIACENHACFIETYWAEWFDVDYRAVVAELDGLDPVEMFLARHEARFEEVA